MTVPIQCTPDETFVLNLGPQHPATHGVLRVKLTMDGEYIVKAEPVLGYIHRMHEKMAESGCYMAILPVESGSQYVLSKLMRKPLNLGAVPDLVKSFKRYNIALEVFLVIGVPGETFAHIKETFDYIHTLGIFRVHFNYAMPIPSTPLYAQYRALKKDSGAYESNRAGHYEWNFDYRIPVISTEDWTNRELKKFVTKKILQFYIRFIFLKPHIFLKEIFQVAAHFSLFKEVIRYYGNTFLRK